MTQGNQPNPNEPNPYQPSSGLPSSGQPAYGYGQPQYDGQTPSDWSGSPTAGQPQYGGQARYEGQPQYGVQPPYGFGQPQQASPQQPGSYGQPGNPQQDYYQPAQQTSPRQPGSYGQPGYPDQNYYQPAQQAYGQPLAGSYGHAEPARSPLLGMIALGVVAVATVVFAWAMWRAGSVMGPVIASNGGSMTSTELAEVMMDQLGGAAMAAMNLAFYTGLAGWITGIVAASTRRGRSYGVWAIVLGLLAPVVGMFVMAAALMPYLNF